MYNIKRLAYEINPPPEAALAPGSTDDPVQLGGRSAPAPAPMGSADGQIDEIVRRVLAELKK
jgi:hypothetical protein